MATTRKEVSEVKFAQEHRLIRIKTILDDKELVLERFSGTESLSVPYEYQLSLLSRNPDVDMKSLLRTNATIYLVLADSTDRYINGILSSVRQGGYVFGDWVSYEATLVPNCRLLALKEDCRIFQKKTVKQIISQILDDASISDYRFNLTGTYEPREYCVQYRETNLNFISRLAEEEGIFYYFEHEEKKHTMVFRDKSEAVANCPPKHELSYSYSREGLGTDADAVLTLERVEQVHSGKVTLEDYNFETPNNDLKAEVASTAGKGEEVYSYPGKYETVDGGSRYARLGMEARECGQFVVRGTSRARVFRSGYRFKLKDHFREDTNQEYVLVSVTHEAFDETYRSGSQGDNYGYRNSFEALPKSIPYRPPLRARKPVIFGSQTALVVGVSGEEIYVDKYGRVKVQFYWDREGKKDENSSCWVRVSQIWAGKNWGWITIPRIGQEVVVDFLEGDPDRPLITGRVYNADQTVPYALPANQTQSGIKSRSSKQGGSDNFNEIRFEDKKDNELVNVQAEKDMKTLVKNDDTQTVQNDRKITVSGKHTETIQKDTTIKITEGNLSVTLDQGNETRKLSVGNQSITLDTGNQTTKVSLGKIDTSAMQSITLTVGPSSIKIDPMGVTINAPMIKINGETMVQIQADVLLDMSGAITMINT